jgi:hypothetical protein
MGVHSHGRAHRAGKPALPVYCADEGYSAAIMALLATSSLCIVYTKLQYTYEKVEQYTVLDAT